MPDTEVRGPELPRARSTAHHLRDQLVGIGVPQPEADLIDVRVKTDGNAYVHVGDLSVSSADRVLEALRTRNAPGETS